MRHMQVQTLAPYSPYFVCTWCSAMQLSPLNFRHHDDCVAYTVPQSQCDCCGRMAWVSRCWAAGGVETFACDDCRGW